MKISKESPSFQQVDGSVPTNIGLNKTAGEDRTIVAAADTTPSYIIRRLTPTESERLMGLPDGWTAHGHDGKPISDTQRYALCGNAIVVNCLTDIMQNIADHLNSEGDD